MTKQEQMRQLKEEKGMSYQTIGGLFGISRQRVHQILSGYITTFKRKRGYIQNAEINKIFKKIFQRDNYICQVCRKKGILIHHIDKNWQNNNFNNLVCLCNNCHLNLHRPKEQSAISREKNRQSHLGKKLSEETKRKIKISAKNRNRNKKGQFV